MPVESERVSPIRIYDGVKSYGKLMIPGLELPKEMLAELSSDNQALTRYFRSAHGTCDKYNDVATASLIEVWIDQTERRTWFLSEIVEGL